MICDKNTKHNQFAVSLKPQIFIDSNKNRLLTARYYALITICHLITITIINVEEDKQTNLPQREKWKKAKQEILSHTKEYYIFLKCFDKKWKKDKEGKKNNHVAIDSL